LIELQLKKTRIAVGAFSIVSLLMLLSVSSSLAAPGPSAIHHTTNLVWGGYYVTGPTASAVNVQGSWVVPTLSASYAGCSEGDGGMRIEVGIDTYFSPGWVTYLEAGTAEYCLSGVPGYYAVAAGATSSYPVYPGDVIWARVHYLGSNVFQMTVQDKTQGWTWITSVTQAGEPRTSVNWIVGAYDYTYLGDFGTAYLGRAYTGFTNTGYATIGTHAGSIGSFKSLAGDKVWEVQMDGWYYYYASEVTSALSASGTSFTVAFCPTSSC
jgi:hypothetical protein